MTPSDPQKTYREFKERFNAMSDEQLIDAFNSDVGKDGWVSARASFHTALREEFEKRHYDHPTGGRSGWLSWDKKVKLINGKIVVKDEMTAKENGLVKCDVCGEYKGKVQKKYLNWEGSYSKEESEKSEEYLGVSCLCDGIPCPKCKKNKIHRPVSNSYDEESNSISHSFYLSGMIPCRECGKEGIALRR